MEEDIKQIEKLLSNKQQTPESAISEILTIVCKIIYKNHKMKIEEVFIDWFDLSTHDKQDITISNITLTLSEKKSLV